jgi:hypothetical protein
VIEVQFNLNLKGVGVGALLPALPEIGDEVEWSEQAGPDRSGKVTYAGVVRSRRWARYARLAGTDLHTYAWVCEIELDPMGYPPPEVLAEA